MFLWSPFLFVDHKIFLYRNLHNILIIVNTKYLKTNEDTFYSLCNVQFLFQLKLCKLVLENLKYKLTVVDNIFVHLFIACSLTYKCDSL